MPLALEGETRKSSDYWQMQQQKQRQQQLQQMQQVCSLNRFILCTIYVCPKLANEGVRLCLGRSVLAGKEEALLERG